MSDEPVDTRYECIIAAARVIGCVEVLVDRGCIDAPEVTLDRLRTDLANFDACIALLRMEVGR